MAWKRVVVEMGMGTSIRRQEITPWRQSVPCAMRYGAIR